MSAAGKYGRLATMRPTVTVTAPHVRALHSRVNGFETIWLERMGARMIHGIASTQTISAKGNAYLPDGCVARLPVPVLYRHDSSPVGEVVFLRKSKANVYVRCVIHHTRAADYVWEKIEGGEVRCFSVASDKAIYDQADGIKFIDSWELKEVSVCPKGANPDCHFEIFLPHIGCGPGLTAESPGLDK